ncbi:LuxR C-terminal-related transcriptional regulator [Pseudaquabacterium rugosum]|uniref:LuxR C-terminal-related transcriptional regulator n=1 Tax=Pseudaquabacterium rugosum TaxID=2984194 RepID=A0ABU9B7P3_9BURK
MSPAIPASPASPLPVQRGRLAPPETAVEAVLPQAVQVLLRSAVLAKLVTVCAPPGYGKTLVLGRLYRLLRQRGVPCVWLTLDDRDTSVDAVLSLLTAALQHEALSWNLPGEAFAALPSDPRESADRLYTVLARLARPVVLCIDNLHVCTDPRLADVLERLVFGTGAALRLALSSTQDLPLDLLRAKLELNTVELQAAHLALDPQSLRALLLQAGLPDPAPALVARMHALTEGWPAAARLLQVLIAQQPASAPGQGAEAVVERFSGRDHDMAAVLTRRVLHGFPARQVEFLMEMALLREFSAELAEDATGCAEAAQWLDDMLRRHVLIFPLDRDRRWLRLHTLLRQHLQAEGARHLPRERRRQVLERAARWHADQGDDEAALEAALAAPAPALAGQLLDRVARTVAGDQGRLVLFVQWSEQVLATGTALSPEAHAWYAWSLCFLLQYERAFSALQSLEHRLAELDPGGQRAAGLRARAGLLRVVISVHLDLLETASDDAQRWLQDPAERDPLGVATVATGAAVAELAQGRSTVARLRLQTALGAIERAASAYGAGWVALIHAAIELTEGDPVRADGHLCRVRPQVVEQLGEDAAVITTLDFVHARALHDLGRTAEARVRALRGLARARSHGINETAQHGLAACVAMWDGAADGEFSPAALDPVVLCYAPRTQRQVAVQQLRRLLALGRIDDAQEFAFRHMLVPDDEAGGDGRPLPERLLALEWAWRIGQQRGLPERVERLKRTVRAAQRWRELLELHLLEVGLHLGGGDAKRAQMALGQALFVAARRRLVQPLLERAATLPAALTQASGKELGLVQPEEIELLARLAAQAAPVPDPAPPGAAGQDLPGEGTVAAAGGLTEPLTRREHELLALLDKGLSNQQIGERVHLSVPTVKWHFYKLYAKLQVKSRSAALVKARMLNLLH